MEVVNVNDVNHFAEEKHDVVAVCRRGEVENETLPRAERATGDTEPVFPIGNATASACHVVPPLVEVRDTHAPLEAVCPRHGVIEIVSEADTVYVPIRRRDVDSKVAVNNATRRCHRLVEAVLVKHERPSAGVIAHSGGAEVDRLADFTKGWCGRWAWGLTRGPFRDW